jgi:hypothetical protein
MHRSVRADTRRGGVELTAGEIDASHGAREWSPRIAGKDGNVERMATQLEPNCGARRLEGKLHATDARRSPGALHVRQRSHRSVQKLRGLVLSAFARERKQGDPLLLPIGPCRECGVVASNNELVVITERSIRKVVKLCDLEDAPVGRDTHACAPNVSSVVTGNPREKQ